MQTEGEKNRHSKPRCKTCFGYYCF